MRSDILTVLAAAALVAGCQSPPHFDPDDPAVLAAIESQLQSAMEGAAKVDPDQVLAAAADDLTFVTGDVVLSGLDDIRARFEDTYSGLASQQQVVLEKRVRILSPDVALVMAAGEGTYTDTAGWTSDPVGLAVTLVYLRREGSWRLVHAHQSVVN